MGNSHSSSSVIDGEFNSVVPSHDHIDTMMSTDESMPSSNQRNDTIDNDNNDVEMLITDDINTNTTITTSNSNITPMNIMNTSININDLKQYRDQFDFDLTEGQIRRGNMTDCEYECSEIFDYLYVGGSKVAESWDTLVKYNITRVVNCSLAVVKNHFVNNENMTYLGLNMVDGREDDISWFLCQVIDFIMESRRLNQKVLIHCEKGVSRSCSFVIAYYMWLSNLPWKQAFEYVKSKRRVCAPNTAFTCNLIEFGELLNSSPREETFYFRCASHLPHDPTTPVLKLCRDPQTRTILYNPTSSDFNPEGVYVIKPSTRSNDRTLYVWKGAEASEESMKAAITLAELIVRNFKIFNEQKLIIQGSEPEAFTLLVQNTGVFNKDNQAIAYKDLYMVAKSSEPVDTQRQLVPSIPTMNISANKRKEPCDETIPKLATPVPAFFVSGMPETDKSAEKRRAAKDNQPSLPTLSISGFKLGELKSIESMTKNANKMLSSSSIKTSSSTSGIALIASENNNESRIPSMPHSSKLRTPPPSDVIRRPNHSGVKLITPPPNGQDQSPLTKSPTLVSEISIPKTPTPPLSKLSLKSSTPPLVGLPSTRPTSATKIPDAVDLARDATPIQELTRVTTPPSSGFSSYEKVEIIKSARDKPRLYQAIPIDNDKNPGYTLKWEAMGVYDDEDLSEDSLMMLACPSLPHYLWIGSSFDDTQFGSDENDNIVKSWISSNIYKGDLDYNSAQGANVMVTGAVIIERSGEESEDFWNMFNLGF